MRARTVAGLALVVGGALLYRHVDAGAPNASATITTTTPPAPIAAVAPPTRVATANVALARAREQRALAVRRATAPHTAITTGAVRGLILDGDGEPLAGVTVIVTPDPDDTRPPASEAAITDEDGTYAITDLAVDRAYHITYYDGGYQRERALPALVAGDDTLVDETFDAAEVDRANATARQQITITLDPHDDDVPSIADGITIDRAYLTNIPVPGRTFEAALGAAAGTQGDSYGTSIVGCAGTLENTYVVDEP